MKEEGTGRRMFSGSYTELHLPRNTPVGFFLAIFAAMVGFALIWRIEWLAVVGLIGAIGVALREFWRTDREVLVSAQEVAAYEHLHGMPEHYVVHANDVEELGELSHGGNRVPVQAGGES
jgi:hypothetical protein